MSDTVPPSAPAAEPQPPRVTGSALYRLFLCLGSGVFPHEDTKTADADDGTLRHRYLEQVVDGVAPDEALRALPARVRAECAAYDVAELPRGETEVAFALNVRNCVARRLGAKLGRAYGPLHPDEIAGTADVCGLEWTASNEIVGFVDDFKTGFQPVTPAARHEQLMFLATCLLYTMRLERARVRILRWVDGDMVADEAWFTRAELDQFVYRLQDRLNLRDHAHRRYLAGGEVATTPGEHCGTCPARGACPRFTALAGELMTVSGPRGPGHDAWLAGVRGALAHSPARRAQVYAFLERTKQLVSLLEHVVREDVAARGPIALEDGRVAGFKTVRRRAINVEVAVAVLRERFPQEVVDRAVISTTTQAAIKRAVGRGVRALMDAIEARGGVSTVMVEEFKPRRPREAADAITVEDMSDDE